ncbi:MAG: formimidoylglutamase [Pseudomonadales bacterium]|nr:formimidoylglutamase [Pseudomonadales bacterium]
MLIDAPRWQGREDPGEHNRWHQQVNRYSGPANNLSIIGFCCDEGVKRNQGRPGAKAGPDAIRSMLSNLIYAGSRPLVDRGNILCKDSNLEAAQEQLACQVLAELKQDNFPIILGGGHEMAWGSYQGIARAFPDSNIGIINFDAHFDLRPRCPQPSSGSPFKQIADSTASRGQDFNYFVFGINQSVNTPSLFKLAETLGVQWLSDIDMASRSLVSISNQLKDFCTQMDKLYLTICLDSFPAHRAPGVSAPASLGISALRVVKLLHIIKSFTAKTVLLDIAELNPTFDIDNMTARLAARLIHEFIATKEFA